MNKRQCTIYFESDGKPNESVENFADSSPLTISRCIHSMLSDIEFMHPKADIKSIFFCEINNKI